MRRLENADEDKFWETWIKDDVIHMYRFGKLGSSGQLKLKRFKTREEAEAELEEKLQQKIGEGYEEIGGDDDAGEDEDEEAAPAPAAKKVAVKKAAADEDEEESDDESSDDDEESSDEEESEDEEAPAPVAKKVAVKKAASSDDDEEESSDDDSSDEDEEEEEKPAAKAEEGDDEEEKPAAKAEEGDDEEKEEEDSGGDDEESEEEEEKEEEEEEEEEEEKPKKPARKPIAAALAIVEEEKPREILKPVIPPPRRVIAKPKPADVTRAKDALEALRKGLGKRSWKVGALVRRARHALAGVAGIDPKSDTALATALDGVLSTVTAPKARLPLEDAIALLHEVHASAFGRAALHWKSKDGPASAADSITTISIIAKAIDDPELGLYLAQLVCAKRKMRTPAWKKVWAKVEPLVKDPSVKAKMQA